MQLIPKQTGACEPDVRLRARPADFVDPTDPEDRSAMPSGEYSKRRPRFRFHLGPCERACPLRTVRYAPHVYAGLEEHLQLIFAADPELQFRGGRPASGSLGGGRHRGMRYGMAFQLKDQPFFRGLCLGEIAHVRGRRCGRTRTAVRGAAAEPREEDRRLPEGRRPSPLVILMQLLSF